MKLLFALHLVIVGGTMTISLAGDAISDWFWQTAVPPGTSGPPCILILLCNNHFTLRIGVRQTDVSLVMEDRRKARVAASSPEQSPNSCLGHKQSPHLARTGQ